MWFTLLSEVFLYDWSVIITHLNKKLDAYIESIILCRTKSPKIINHKGPNIKAEKRQNKCVYMILMILSLFKYY